MKILKEFRDLLRNIVVELGMIRDLLERNQKDDKFREYQTPDGLYRRKRG